MRTTPWTDVHDQLLQDAEPPVPEPTGEDLARVWSLVDREMRDSRPSRRRRVRVGVAAGISAVVLGTSGLAAAELYTARTGEGPVDAEDLRLGGPGEKLQLAAPDFGEVITEETADIPFPSSETRALAIQKQVDDARRAQNDEFASTGAVRAWVARSSVCSWSNQWAAATRDNDEAARTEAIGMIQAAPSWPAVTTIDPEPFSRMETREVTDGKGHTWTESYRDSSQFFYLAALGEAVEGRDLGAAGQILAEGYGSCWTDEVPDLPQADPMHAER